MLADTSFHWRHRESETFSLHYTDSTQTAANPAHALARALNAHADNLALLGAMPDSARIHIFYVVTRAESAHLTGGSGVGWTVAQAGAITLVAPQGEKDPADRHELMHVASLRQWGLNPLKDYWLREGLATHAGELCAPTKVDSIARAMLLDGRARPLAEYRDAFFVPGRDNLPAYMLNASFVKFLLERGGHERLERVWRRGTEALADVYAASPEQLEREWKEGLARPMTSAAHVPRTAHCLKE